MADSPEKPHDLHAHWADDVPEETKEEFDKQLDIINDSEPLGPSEVKARYTDWGVNPIDSPAFMFDCPSCLERAGMSTIAGNKVDTCGLCGFDVKGFLLLQGELNKKEGFLRNGPAERHKELRTKIESFGKANKSSGCAIWLLLPLGAIISLI